jgi:hypothetical protein
MKCTELKIGYFTFKVKKKKEIIFTNQVHYAKQGNYYTADLCE